MNRAENIHDTMAAHRELGLQLGRWWTSQCLAAEGLDEGGVAPLEELAQLGDFRAGLTDAARSLLDNLTPRRCPPALLFTDLEVKKVDPSRTTFLEPEPEPEPAAAGVLPAPVWQPAGHRGSEMQAVQPGCIVPVQAIGSCEPREAGPSECVPPPRGTARVSSGAMPADNSQQHPGSLGFGALAPNTPDHIHSDVKAEATALLQALALPGDKPDTVDKGGDAQVLQHRDTGNKLWLC